MERDRPAWLERLTHEIRAYKERTGATDVEIARAAGLGVNYVATLLSRNWREPSFSKVVQLCHIMGVSITYIATGAKMTRDVELMLSLYTLLPQEKRQTLFPLLETLVASERRSQ